MNRDRTVALWRSRFADCRGRRGLGPTSFARLPHVTEQPTMIRALTAPSKGAGITLSSASTASMHTAFSEPRHD